MPKIALEEIADMKVNDYSAIKRGAVVYREDKASFIMNSEKRVIVVNLDLTLMTIILLLLIVITTFMAILDPVWSLVILVAMTLLEIIKRYWRKHRA